MKSKPFDAYITGTHSVIIPEAHALPFYEAKEQRVVVTASYKDNQTQLHAALKRDRSGTFWIMFSQQHQKTLNLPGGTNFTMQLSKDTSKYGVDMPEELQAVLDTDPIAFEIFESFTAGKKRGLIYGILRYKNSQTRIDKSLILTENLKRGVTDNQLLFKMPS